MITDVGTIEDGSFNQGAWEGIKRYGDEHDIKYTYYQPKDATVEEYLETIKKATNNGAKLIVCPGILPEVAVFEAQTRFPKTKFILLDGIVHNSDYTDYTIGENVMPISFREEQAGFLAGYAAVRDGYTRLGFMGGDPEDSVIRFGYGFVQGADYAAIEIGSQVDIEYAYSGTFLPSDDVHNKCCEWYEHGTQIIFAAGGEMGESVMKAAEHYEGTYVIGVDVDQSYLSDKVVTSALKQLSNAVYNGIDSYYNDNFNGGMVTYMGADNDGIGLEMDNSKFTQFTKADYEAIMAKLKDGSVEPYAETNVGTTEELMMVNINVDYQSIDLN